MAYIPIAKLDNFTGKEDDAQVWLNDMEKAITANRWNDIQAMQAILYFLKDTADSWYQSLINKPQDFNAFKVEFLRYFSNNNSINCLVNTFTTMKQGETEAVTTYLGHFHRNLCQIQAIDTNYFTVPQILNQFIHGLRSSILQHVCPLHLGTLQNAVICARDFESAKSKANHAQAINLVMNRSSELDSKLKQFSNSINQKLEGYLTDNHTIYQPPKRCSNSGNYNCFQNQAHLSTLANQQWQPEMHVCHNCALANNILPATVTNDKLFVVIFPFDLKETIEIPLFSGAALEEKPITIMYMNAKIDGHTIKLILNSESAGSIITRQLMDQLADGAIKTPIGKINNLPIEINGIMVPIKVFVMEATQYQALVGNNWLSKTHATLDWTTQELQLTFGATCSHFKPSNAQPLIEFEKETRKLIWEVYQVSWANEDHNKLPPIFSWDDKGKGKKNKELTWKTDQNWKTDNDQDEPANWEERRKKKEPLSPVVLIIQMCTFYHHQPIIVNQNWNASITARNCCQWAYAMAIMKNTPQPQDFTAAHWDNQPCLVCETILPDKGIWSDIPGHGGTCDKTCQMMYAKAESVTTSKLLEIKNNLLSLSEPKYVQIVDIFGNIEDDPKEFYEHYQHLAPTRKEQEQCLEQLNTRLCQHCLIPCDFQYCNECDLIYNPPPCMIYTIPEEEKPISSCASELESTFNYDSNSDNNDDKNTSFSPFSDNNKGIMPEHVHNTDAGFDLRYPGKDAIKLELHSHICLDLKIALEILATTMVQLAFKSSLVKREINIRRGIIDVGYVGNIIAMLQNDSEKAYIIEPNEKIAQAIFLPLVRVAQLVLVGKREELGITVKEIQGFESTGRIDVPVNMAEEEIVDQGEIISTGQAISIPPYGQYMIEIKWEVKEQNQIFEAEPILCKSGEIGLINFHIPAKDYSHIKIPIYNNTRNVIIIPAGITIRYLSTEIKDQSPSTILDFP
ncbi:hypothetical protein G9A89_004825 [Geosiphon pyriformis]|nr:hypothetical protein G9A89_004825 [Geosiphon pyriformis]